MKRLTLLIVILATCQIAISQNWDEWTRQKRTAIKRLMEQIAANKVYIEYAQKGYRIVTDGLQTIRDIKDGDFNLHLGFIDDLKKVNPKITNSSKVTAIITLQLRIVQSRRKALAAIRESNQFGPDEMDYCRKVFDNLFNECLKDVDELLTVITHGDLSMPDDERLQRIDRIYSKMQDKGAFCSSFSNEMSVLAIQRLSQQHDVKYSKRLNGFE